MNYYYYNLKLILLYFTIIILYNILLIAAVVKSNPAKIFESKDSLESEPQPQSSRKTTLLLTGAAGFAGSHALRHFLVNTDWDIICPISFSHRGLPERLTTAVGANGEAKGYWARIKILKCDLSCPVDELTKQRIGPHVDYIINYASESSVDRSIDFPTSFIKNNIDLELNLLELARELSPKLFIQISTDEVYGPALHGTSHEEWSSIIPSNPYSASKASQEAIAISYWRTYSIPLIIINCMNLIGETQDPEKFIPKIITNVMTGLPVPIHASLSPINGSLLSIGSRSYLHTRNLADAILFLISRGSASKFEPGRIDRPDRWNVVGLKEVNNLEMAQLIAKILRKPLKYELIDFHTNRPGHDPRYALNGAKIREAGWSPPIEFEASLRRLIDWTMKNPIWIQRGTEDSSSSMKGKIEELKASTGLGSDRGKTEL